MRIAHVALDIPAQALDQAFSYSIPADMEVYVGCAVLVPFGGRCAIGFVISLDGVDSGSTAEDDSVRERDAAKTSHFDIDPHKLRPIIRCVSQSYFNEDGAACAQFLSDHYLAPLSSCVRLFTPPGSIPRLVHSHGSWHVQKPKIGQVDDRWVIATDKAATFTPRKNAVKQQQILQAVRQGDLRMADLSAEYGQCAQSVRTLEKYGVVHVVHRRHMRGMTSGAKQAAMTEHATVAIDAHASAKPELIQGQKDALLAIKKAYAHHDGHVVVVDGVTGSGKTEVYLRAIEHVLRDGKTAIVLVPEISLTPQTVARFRGRFGDMVAVMHSRMTPGERYDQWDFIRSGDARVVVGARSALFTPIKDIGLIVIDEEHEGSYKQDQAPRYVSRDVALWMAKRQHAALVLGSATPSITTLYRSEHDPTWTCVKLPKRVNGRPLPKIEIVNMSHEFGGGNRSMFSHKLTQAIHAEIKARHKVVLFLNQRGFAKFLLCRQCGYVPQCPYCSSSLTYHEYGHQLVCHHCGYTEKAPVRCPKCGSPYLKKFGAGTQRVEVELQSLIRSFNLAYSVPIIRMDFDTTRKKGAHQALLEKFAASDAAILLGTQMIAKGLDFDDVTLVGVINADTELHMPDYNAQERTFQLIEQVAGRAGRAGLPGHVLVQTYTPNALSIQSAAHYDRDGFLAYELPRRKKLGYPPFVRLAVVLVWGVNVDEVQKEAQRLWKIIATYVHATCETNDNEAAHKALLWAAGKKEKKQSPKTRAQDVQATLDLFSLGAKDDPIFRHSDTADTLNTTDTSDASDSSGTSAVPSASDKLKDASDDSHDTSFQKQHWDIFPAVACPLAKLANKYRYHIIIKAPVDADIAHVLAPVFRARKAAEHVHATIDIDPDSLV